MSLLCTICTFRKAFLEQAIILLKTVLLRDMAELLDKLSREGSISLETYGHQVGGHHLLFKFEEMLCKPVNERERFFYATAPDEIKRYIPGYFGELHCVIALRYSPVLAIAFLESVCSVQKVSAPSA